MTPVTPMPDCAWVLLPSGRRLDLLTPDPDAWTDRDLAIGLSRTSRWGGHSRWELPLSVAQHSLLVLVIRQRRNMLHPMTRAEAMRELLHDADEGLLGFDPISPLKPHLGDGFKSVSDRLRASIDARYKLLPWSGDDRKLHKQADHLAAGSEAFHVTRWPREAIRDSLHIQFEPVADNSLPLLVGMQPWEPWPPRIAAALFLAKLRELTSADAHARNQGSLSDVVDRETTIQTLASSFSRLPPRQRRRSTVQLTGNSLTDTYVFAEADDGSQNVEYVVVAGARDDDGTRDFDADFTIFTTDEEIEDEAAWCQTPLVAALETANPPPKCRASGLAFVNAVCGGSQDRNATLADQLSPLLDATGYRAMLRENRAETTEGRLENLQELIQLAGDFIQRRNCSTTRHSRPAARTRVRRSGSGS